MAGVVAAIEATKKTATAVNRSMSIPHRGHLGLCDPMRAVWDHENTRLGFDGPARRQVLVVGKELEVGPVRQGAGQEVADGWMGMQPVVRARLRLRFGFDDVHDVRGRWPSALGEDSHR